MKYAFDQQSVSVSYMLGIGLGAPDPSTKIIL